MPGCEGWTGPGQSLVDVSAEGPGVGDPHRLVVSLAVGLEEATSQLCAKQVLSLEVSNLF